jgi:glycerate 2-kinase
MANGFTDTGDVLLPCYRAAIAAVQPERAMWSPLRDSTTPNGDAWIIAVGKAAPGMARAIVTWLTESGREPAGGIIVSTHRDSLVHPSLDTLVGNHPIPFAQSERAALAIANLIDRMPESATVHVAISGGASALIAAPLAGLSMADVTVSFERMMHSGLDIAAMNAVRKHLTRFSAGRLAIALYPRHIHTWIISDVPGDDPATIASGPCTASADDRIVTNATTVLLPDAARRALDTPLPDLSDRRLASVTTSIVATNATALAAAVAEASARGIQSMLMPEPLTGDASVMGQRIASALLGGQYRDRMLVWGGETTVALSATSGRGGRAQQIALSAAGELRGASATLLCAGTDGRDGPTDAAGAIVDGATWNFIAHAGREPSQDLQRHNAYPSLDCVGALIRTGDTGTNVMDVALAMDRS